MGDDESDGRQLLDVKKQQSIPLLFAAMGIAKVTRKDAFTLEYAQDFLTATVTRENGAVEVVRKQLGGGFYEMSAYDPSRMDKKTRNKVIVALTEGGQTQSQIARRIGFTQATVSNVLRRHKKDIS